MSARPLRRPSRASSDGAEGEAEPRLHTVPEAFVAEELARLEGSTEARIDKATERIREELSQASEAAIESKVVASLDERLAGLERSIEGRFEQRVDARLKSLEDLADQLRTDTERLSAGLRASSDAVVERAGVLLYEQIRRTDAAELERTRVTQEALKALGEDVHERQRQAEAELETRLSQQIEAAVATLNERFEALEGKTGQTLESSLVEVKRRSEAELDALADRAGLLVYERIRAADSRVEGAVIALAREIDVMRSILREAAEVPPAKLPVPEPRPRFARLRRAFRLGR